MKDGFIREKHLQDTLPGNHRRSSVAPCIQNLAACTREMRERRILRSIAAIRFMITICSDGVAKQTIARASHVQVSLHHDIFIRDARFARRKRKLAPRRTANPHPSDLSGCAKLVHVDRGERTHPRARLSHCLIRAVLLFVEKKR